MVKCLRKVDCSRPTGHHMKLSAPLPLENILAAPLRLPSFIFNEVFTSFSHIYFHARIP